MMLLWGWESSSLRCSQQQQPGCQEQHSYRQQLLCHQGCKLGSPSSQRISSHRISICLDHSCELLESHVKMTSLAQAFMDIQQASPLDKGLIHIKVNYNFGLEVNRCKPT